MSSVNFLHLTKDGGVDWDQQKRSQAKQDLAANIELAGRRRLEAGAERFQPTRALAAAINAALASRSPLLLTGAPGTGKTQTAYFLAEYFGLAAPHHFQVRSDSSARDLRYDFDAVAYLQDAYAKDSAIAPPPAGCEDPRSNDRYLTKGKLWQAFEHQDECVLLIDEIDKAPRDFPNDLLQELSEARFAHPFEAWEVKNQGPPPMVIITSNDERRLPDPFLRRCICCHIELDDQLLIRILDAWDSAFAPQLKAGVRDAALPLFQTIRERLHGPGREPGVAELLVWLNVLAVQQIAAPALAVEDLAELPGIACLIKEHEDLARLGTRPGQAPD